MTDRGFAAIGRPFLRPEDRRLLIGFGRFVDDVEVPAALWVRFVRSPHAHARLRSIKLDAARAAPGVVAAVDGPELAAWTKPLRVAPPIEGVTPTRMDSLPIKKTRFVGDPVACVVATDRYLAEDAAELVEVDYEPLMAVASAEAALEQDAPLVDDELQSNLVAHQHFATPNLAVAFQKAARIVSSRFRQARQTHAPIEPRGCLAVWDSGRDHLTIHIGCQAPHPYRTQLAWRLGMEESAITVRSADVGGGFGQKIALYREELAVAALARALKRSVRWSEDRMENLLASSHAREQVVMMKAAVDGDGRVLGLEMQITEDFGAYCFFPPNYTSSVVGLILTGPYRIENYGYEIRSVLTNKCGNGPMRAPMCIASWAMDGALDRIAAELGLDPMEVRRINMLRSGDLPHRTATGQLLEDITPRETFEAALDAIDYQGFRKKQVHDRARGIFHGLGVCQVVESTTYGSEFYRSAGIPGSGHEAAWVRIDPSGAVSASTGLGPTGQGYEAPFAQVVAEGLGVPPAQVRILMGDTDVAPYGMGSRGSRGGVAGSGALFFAAGDLRRKALLIAAGMLNLNSPDQLRIVEGKILHEQFEGGADTGVTLADVARRAYLDPTRLPSGIEPGLFALRAYEPPPVTFSNATHLCQLAVDAETGRIEIVRYIVAEDCGVILNPAVVEGQQHGAVAQGIGGALLEEIVYDSQGQNLCASFADYKIPTACEIPQVEIISMHTPNLRGALGVKGMAEGGVMGANGAVSLAVADALVHLGLCPEDQPFTPERLRDLLRGRIGPVR